MSPTKTKTARKKPVKKKKARFSLRNEKSPSQKQTRKNSRKPPNERPYREPKTAAELGITCSALVDGVKCGKAVMWFDYAIGERNHMSGLICDEHRVSNRVEKLAVREEKATSKAAP